MPSIDRPTRRAALQSVGTVTMGVLGLHGVLGGAVFSGDGGLYERGQRILLERGHAAYERFLEEHDVAIDAASAGVPRRGIGRERVADGGRSRSRPCVEPRGDCELDLQVDMHLNEFPERGYVVQQVVQYRYEYAADQGGVQSGPDGIPDGAVLRWDPESWDLATPRRPFDSMSPPEYGDWDNGSYANSGSGSTLFEIRPAATVDADARSRTDSGTYWATAVSEVDVERQSGHSPGDEIQGIVRHLWGAPEDHVNFSVTFGPNGRVGIDYSTTSDVEDEDVGSTASGKRLAVEA